MKHPFITCKGGYKYQLRADYYVETGIKPFVDFNEPEAYLKLDLNGNLTILKGYAWDGPSGPVKDTHRNLRGSLVHDAFYQLLRAEILAVELKDDTDLLFKQMCVEDGVWRGVAQIYYLGLKHFGSFAADPANRRVELNAPRKNE